MTVATSSYRDRPAPVVAGVWRCLAMIGVLVFFGVPRTARGADPTDPLQTLQRQIEKRRFSVLRGAVGDPTTWSDMGGIDPKTWELRNPWVKWPDRPISTDVVSAYYYGGTFEDEQTGAIDDAVPLTDEQTRLLARIPTLRLLAFGDADLKPSHLGALASLAELKILYISQNSLTEEDFVAIGRMKELRSLYFGIEKGIDDIGLKQLASLSKLVSLSFSGGRGMTDDGLRALAGLKSLRSLKIDGAPITDAGLVHLASLQSLRVLIINARQVDGTGVRHLATVPLLELTLPGATSDGLKGVARCVSLHKLDISGWKPKRVELNALADMPNLWWLAARCDIANEGIRDLHKLVSLRYLDLTGCVSIDDGAAEYLAKMTSLQHLELNSTRITEAGLVQLKTLSNLRWLTLPWGDDKRRDRCLEIKKLREALPHCTISGWPPTPWEFHVREPREETQRTEK